MQQITIAGVEAVPVFAAGERAFRISEGTTRTHVSVVLRVTTSVSGLEGHGEAICSPPGKPEEFIDEIVGAVERFIKPALVGARLADRTSAVARVEASVKGRIWTKAAVNVALYDAWAKSLGLPVHALLGGRVRDSVPVTGPVISVGPPDEMARLAAEQIAAGYAAVKIKIGETIASDIARVAAVREAVGPKAALRVDANDHYAVSDAIQLVRAIERFEPEHVEQPLARNDLLGMAELRGKIGVPLTTDDMVATPSDAMNVIRLAAADRIKVKVTKHGFDGARRIIAMAQDAGVGVVLGQVVEMGLAAVAEAHMALAAPNLIMPCEIGSLRSFGVTTDIVNEDLYARLGYVTVPDGPGLGVTLNRAMIERSRELAA
jgi:L-alanine-DL-glutamate epimerase-like enolase superfamily enzyme